MRALLSFLMWVYQLALLMWACPAEEAGAETLCAVGPGVMGEWCSHAHDCAGQFQFGGGSIPVSASGPTSLRYLIEILAPP